MIWSQSLIPMALAVGTRAGSFSSRDNDNNTCTVKANGVDDTDAFEQAVKQCGIGGTINLPDSV